MILKHFEARFIYEIYLRTNKNSLKTLKHFETRFIYLRTSKNSFFSYGIEKVSSVWVCDEFSRII